MLPDETTGSRESFQRGKLELSPGNCVSSSDGNQVVPKTYRYLPSGVSDNLSHRRSVLG